MTAEPRSFFGPNGPAPATAGGKTLDTHTRLLLDEESPRHEYIEDYYREKLRFKEESFGSVREKIGQIKSLSAEEKTHIIAHLRGGALSSQMAHLMRVSTKRRRAARSRARERKREREIRIYGRVL